MDEEKLKGIHKTLDEIERQVTVPSIFEQPNLIALTIGLIILVFVVKYFLNKRPNNPDNKESNDLKIAKRDLKLSNFSTYTFLFLTCLTGVQLAMRFTVPAVTNFATIAALYLVLEDNSSKSRRIVKQLKKEKEVVDNSLVDSEQRIEELENQINSLTAVNRGLEKQLDLLKEENKDMKKDIDGLKKENHKKNSFSLFNINK